MEVREIEPQFPRLDFKVLTTETFRTKSFNHEKKRSEMSQFKSNHSVILAVYLYLKDYIKTNLYIPLVGIDKKTFVAHNVKEMRLITVDTNWIFDAFPCTKMIVI